MEIEVENAYANNLKNISVNIPLKKITAITGVSGSGKSTLLKNILANYGYRNFSRIAPKTIRDALKITNEIEVDEIKNLPNTIFIDVKNSINTSSSTVSTISGIHGLLRNLFSNEAKIICTNCKNEVQRDYSLIKDLSVDLSINELFKDVISFIEENGKISRIDFFDKNQKPTKIEKNKALATIYFSLSKINEKIIHDFNLKFYCRVQAKKSTEYAYYDFLREIECSQCHSILPALNTTRFSFNTNYSDGGGACRNCAGTGFITTISPENIFTDKEKSIFDGASNFLDKKGLKYTTVTEKFIEAVFKYLNIDTKTPIKMISDNNLHSILYGMATEITFTDRIGGKKTKKFEGIINYLKENYKNGKGKNSLNEICTQTTCEECKGIRLDKNIQAFSFYDKDFSSILHFTLKELEEWCACKKEFCTEKSRGLFEKIISECKNFDLLSCSHLTLSRASNTLSGGELQRIRLCSLLNSNVQETCFLLDEPSSGLHYSDIEKLGTLLEKIKKQGNSIILVEHNKKLLQYCDYIIDMGETGGKNGGKVLFSDSVENIARYKTATTIALTSKNEDKQLKKINFTDYLEFNNLTLNNLKNVSVKFPKNAFTAVCGISGSGKSTFIKKAVFPSVSKKIDSFGFSFVEYFAQESKIVSVKSTVATILNLPAYIANFFAKKSEYSKNTFLLTSQDGKCDCCKGKGEIYSSEEEFIGICEKCDGKGFTEDVLKVKVDGLNIYEIYNMPLDEMATIINNEKLREISISAKKLGVGYLTLSRAAKSLSKGELQRVSLVKVLAENEKNKLLILDEPSKGLHFSDSFSLLNSIREIVSNNNTVIAVEHNPDLIKNADYLIEFGGTGINGGYLLFQGRTEFLKDTPTAKMLENFNFTNLNAKDVSERKITFTNEKKFFSYSPFCIYFEKEHKENLIKAAKKSRDVFLSSAIPNNYMFSHFERNFIESSTPLIVNIDFSEKINYNISIADALDISRWLMKIAEKENKNKIAKYIFDRNSITGKCTVCKGKGKLFAVDEINFMENGNLSSDCKKFLRNSTDLNIKLPKTLSEITENEKKVLFWGNESWKGIIPSFMEYHKYYPNDNGEVILKNKKEIICPVCNGSMLKDEFLAMKCVKLSYAEWQNLCINELLKKLQYEDSKEIMKIKNILSDAVQLEIGHLRLSDELVNLEAAEAEMIKFISYYMNRIFGTGLILKNIELLSKSKNETILDFAKKLSESNTIWIV